jgi:hypothetical protein
LRSAEVRALLLAKVLNHHRLAVIALPKLISIVPHDGDRLLEVLDLCLDTRGAAAHRLLVLLADVTALEAGELEGSVERFLDLRQRSIGVDDC